MFRSQFNDIHLAEMVPTMGDRAPDGVRHAGRQEGGIAVGIEYVEVMIMRCDACSAVLGHDGGPGAGIEPTIFTSRAAAIGAAERAGWEIKQLGDGSHTFDCPLPGPSTEEILKELDKL